MSTSSKVFLGLAFTTVVVCCALILFLRHLVTKSFPVTSGSLVVSGLHQPVDVYRDEYGVPHVKARDDHDLMFAAGYVHAQDRLWQMDLMRRAGEGRLSEIFGATTVEYDKLFRTIGLTSSAGKIAEQLHPESRRMLEDYTEGVNGFISTHRGAFPAEFDMLNYEPEPWKIEQSIIVARLMAWELNLAWWTDLTYGEIASRVPAQKLAEVLPFSSDSLPAIAPSSFSKKTIAGLHDLLNVERSYREYFGLGSLEAGSNGWVIDSSKSSNGKPLLANDPHLAMPAPSRWYELHLNAPGWNVAGVSLPGIPVIVIGHNDRLAWGLTNAMIDDADFYVEHTDSTNPHHYLFEKSSLPFEEREEKILVKEGDSILMVARATKHGPVISGVHPSSKHTDADSAFHHEVIAMRWTGLDVSDELYGFYLMNRSATHEEFEQGVKEISVPGQSVVYADVDGNIAYWTAAHIPIRGKQNPMLPLTGWTGEAEWKGFVPFSQLPKLLNPSNGIIACANQKLTEKPLPYYVSALWEPRSRIQRIQQMLHSSEKFSVDDFKQFQQDIMSPYAQEVVAHLLSACKDSASLAPRSSEALTYLRNWDYRFTQSDIATSIFNAFFSHLLKNIYEDEMGSDIFHDFVYFGAIPYRVTSQLLTADSSAWFDDVTTDHVETKVEILRKSLSDGIAELRSTMGEEMKSWRWGTLHTVTFKHPFGDRKPLDNIFNIGPFPMSGGGTTVNKSEYKFTLPYAVSVGASMREVIDLARPQEAFMVITSGESGQPLQKHYDDQTPLWLNGGYHSVITDWNIIEHTHWDHLELRP